VDPLLNGPIARQDRPSRETGPGQASTSQEDKATALRNVLSNWGGYILSNIIAFFLSPFVVHRLGDSAYGVWALLVSLTSYLGLLELGVRGAVTRYVAKYHAQADHQGANRIASTALAFFTAAGSLVILISFGLAFFALDAFRIPEEYQRTARIVLSLMGMTIATSTVGGVFGGIMVGLQRFDLVNSVEVVISVLRALAIVFALQTGKGIISLAWIQLASSVASGLGNAWLCFKLYPQLRIHVHDADRRTLGFILSFSMYTFLMSVFAAIFQYADVVVIGLYLPVSLITYFSIAGNLFTYSTGLIRGITTMMTPLASSLEAEGKEIRLQKVTLHASRYATALSMAIGVTLVLRGGTFIGLWMGEKYASLSGQVLFILALASMVGGGPAVSSAVMIGISRHRVLVPLHIVEAVASLITCLALVNNWGIIGVAWGKTLPTILLCLSFWPWYVRRTLGIPMMTYVLSTWGRPLLAMMPFAACTYAMEKSWPAASLVAFFFQVGLALPVAVAGFWHLCLPPDERQSYLKKLKQSIATALCRT
jgi:O-antigen/teichoic acid export membrane protein